MNTNKNNKILGNKSFINKIFLIILVAIPPLICLVFIHLYGENSIYWDEWLMVINAKQLDLGQASFITFWGNHNEHRIFFPKIAYLLLAKLTGFNSKAQMYFSYAHILVVYLMFAQYIKSINKGKGYYLKLAVVGLILFNFTQSQNLLWGFQIGFFMCWFYSVLSIYLLYLSIEKKKSNLFIGSILSGVVASFSSLQGLMVWPALIISIILCLGKTIFKNRRFQILFCTSVLTYIVYFINFDFGHAKKFLSSSKTIFMENTISFVKSYFNLLGSSIFSGTIDILVAGIAVTLFILFVTILILKKVIILKEKDIFSIGLFLYGLFFIGITLVGRVNPNGVASRYMTFTKLVSIGISLFIFSKDRKECTRDIFSAFIGLVIFAMVLSNVSSINPAKADRLSKESSNYYLYTYDSQPDKNLKTLFPDAQTVKDHAEYLKEKNYNVFSNKKYIIPSIMYDVTKVSDGAYAAYDKNSILVTLTDADKYFTVTSWAVDKIAEDVASGVYIEINDVLYDSIYSGNRPDVAKSFNNPNYTNSGFFREFSTSLLHEGDNPVKLKILSNDKTFYSIIDNGIVICKEGENIFVK